MGLLRRALALEDNSDGSAVKEIEHVFYCRIVDLKQLEKAESKERQEQWELKIPKTQENGGAGVIRIRKTSIEGKPDEYVMTTKTPTGDGGRMEVGIPTTEANFAQFKLMSERGMHKDRYHFPVEGTDLVFEVDMFLKPEGGYWEWCKIDLEVKSKSEPVPPLPITVEDLITAEYGHRTDAEEAKITSLYLSEFITRNPARAV